MFEATANEPSKFKQNVLSLLVFGFFSTKSVKMAEFLILPGEVCEIFILLGLQRGLRARGRSLSADGRSPGV